MTPMCIFAFVICLFIVFVYRADNKRTRICTLNSYHLTNLKSCQLCALNSYPANKPKFPNGEYYHATDTPAYAP